MGSKYNIILQFLYISAVLSGCRCKDLSPPVPPRTPPLDAYTYWPADSNTQWIYSVSKEISSNMVYQYDDTLQFLKDTSISNKNDIYFREFAFKKLTSGDNLIIGTLPDNPGKLYLLLNGVLYTLYDLNTMSEQPPGRTFTTNGIPIDVRFEMKYTSPYGSIPTQLGTVKYINSYYTFLEKHNLAGRIARTVAFAIGEKKGPVRIEYIYDRRKVDFTNDSMAHYLYEIKKINP